MCPVSGTAIGWAAEQIADGRHREEECRRKYYVALNRKHGNLMRRLWQWIRALFGR